MNEGSDDWVSLHAYYHGDLDVLLVQCVRPLLALCASQQLLGGAFFVRYWNGGQHLRLRLRPGSARTRSLLVRTAVSGLHEYLKRCPGPAQPPEEYACSTRTLQLGRLHDEEVLPLAQPNSVRCSRYTYEADRYGGVAARSVVEAHFCYSSALSMRVVSGLTPRARQAWVMAAMAAAASCLPGGLAERAEFFMQYGTSACASASAGAACVPEASSYRSYDEVHDTVLAILARSDPAAGNGEVEPWCASWIRHIRATLSSRDFCRREAGGAPPASVLVSMLHMLNNRIGVGLSDEACIAWLLSHGYSKLNGSRSLVGTFSREFENG